MPATLDAELTHCDAPMEQPAQDNPLVPPKPKRRGPGRPFVKGQSGNPSGRKRRYGKTITAIARDASPRMMRTLIAIADDLRAPPGVRATCADKVLDRAWGKPEQVRTLAVGVGRLSDLSDEALLAILSGQDDGPPLLEHNATERGQAGELELTPSQLADFKGE